MNIICDIGGTNMRVAAAIDGRISRVHKVPTPPSPREGVGTFRALAQEIAQGEPISRVVGCIAGNVDNIGIISDARNLRGWEGTNIVAEFSSTLGASVHIVNDAALVGLGEACSGAGKGVKRLAYVTVSTGVGGALITDGAITASGGIAAVQVRGSDLENLVSGTAVRRRFGVDPRELTSSEVHTVLADELAEGLREVVLRWSPDSIVLGGSMIVGINPIPIARTHETLQRLLDGTGVACPALRRAELEDMGGLHGAIALLTQLNS